MTHNKSSGTGPVIASTGSYDMSTVRVTSTKRACFCHWQAEVVIVGVTLRNWFLRRQTVWLNNKIRFALLETQSLTQGEVSLWKSHERWVFTGRRWWKLRWRVGGRSLLFATDQQEFIFNLLLTRFQSETAWRTLVYKNLFCTKRISLSNKR